MKFPRFPLITLLTMITMVFVSSCTMHKTTSFKETFEQDTWYRYRKLSFTLQTQPGNHYYDLRFRIKYTDEFDAEKLPINLTLITPDGEDRTRDYQLRLRDVHKQPLGEKGNGCHIFEYQLKRDLKISSEGLLRIEIENLMPKIETKGIREADLIVTAHF